ncbi:hypothetical protein SAMN04487968_101297 [Nocardioides terrae]|uniref:Sulfotransferase family protein n=1 Tax=Nocardioides terrae TaxID=574651 RepID=A0A1I1DJ01_9ACTN|nr:hypothetical protein [Nocardioides terrae]SFB74925.1 hypothetical protein SAMN04487968_101297 [Nocardioides terrae]
MAERVVLHVGLMKSGTSHLQARLGAAREGLADAGFLFPGAKWRDQVNAVSDALGRRQRAHGEFGGAWETMVAEIDAFPGTAIISMEFLGSASADKLRTVVESFPSTRVEAVVTVRDLGRTIPSMWQETLKNARTWPWREYVDGVRHRRGPGEVFWNEQDAVAVTRKWAELVGPDAVTVVTLPRSAADPELLWRRFCEAVGLPTEAAAPPESGNESLGAASAQLMERINHRVADLAWPDYSRHVKFGIAKTILPRHRRAEPALGFKVTRWVRRLAEAQRAGLAASGVRVVGDLADLEPVASAGVSPEKVGVEAQLDAALHALEELVRRSVAEDPQSVQRRESQEGTR